MISGTVTIPLGEYYDLTHKLENLKDAVEGKYHAKLTNYGMYCFYTTEQAGREIEELSDALRNAQERAGRMWKYIELPWWKRIFTKPPKAVL